MPPLPSRTQILFWSLISFAITVASGGSILAIWDWLSPCPVEGENRVWGSCYRNLQAQPLTIGVGSFPGQDYKPLVTYLQNQLGSAVNIDRDTEFNDISERLARKDWDLAFTRSPVLSIAAADQGYVGVATMFPQESRYYRAALYVRADSSIKSIADIKSTTTIALGSPDSAPTFLLPIYALYGKTLRIGSGYAPPAAANLVKAGKIDVGAGRYSVVKDDPALRVIYVSRAIPAAGVYLSPLLSNRDRDRITQALLNAPAEIQAQANYSNRPVPQYDELRKIISRTETVLACPELNVNLFNLSQPVKLFCASPNQVTEPITGQVREYQVPTTDSVEFKVVTQENQVYLVLVPQQILTQRRINPSDTVEKLVRLADIKPQKLSDGVWRVNITKPHQLSVVKLLNIS